MRHCWLLLPLLALPAVAADPPKHRAEGDAAIAARKVLVEHCAPCHGDADPKKRQGRLWATDWSSLVGNAGPVAFVSQDKDDLRSQVLEFMQDGSMPPGGRKRPTPEQIKTVEDWIKAGAPQFPQKFDDDEVLKLITDDLVQVQKDKGKDYSQNVRYVSLAHLVEKKGADLAKAEAELATALTGRTHGGKIRLSKPKLEQLQKGDKPPANAANVANKAAGPVAGDLFGKIVRPVPGSAGTVYRLDLKELGWDGGSKPLFEWAKFAEPEGDFNMKPFDLIHLEYPYSHATTDPDRKKATDAAVAAMHQHRNKTDPNEPLAQVRPVPFVRGDWLTKALWQGGKPTPLADDLDSLADLAVELANSAERQVGTGPDFVPFQGGEKVPDDATALPVWAWYQPTVTPKKDPPFKFTFATEGADPLKEGGSFKLTADCDRDVVVSLVEVQADYLEVLRFGEGKPDERRPATDVPAKKNTVISPNSKGRLSPTIIAANKGKPLYYLLFVSSKDAPHGEPVVVRSKHKESAVWRVLPAAADAAADRGPPVRGVVRIEVEVKKKMD